LRRLEGTPKVEPGEAQQNRAQDDYDDPGPGGGRRRALFRRALNQKSLKISGHCQGSGKEIRPSVPQERQA
jgi:hypothetical protein